MVPGRARAAGHTGSRRGVTNQQPPPCLLERHAFVKLQREHCEKNQVREEGGIGG